MRKWVYVMSKKAEYLKQMGWTQELIEHFMIDDMNDENDYNFENQTSIVESSSMTLRFENAKANTNMTLSFN